jgi:hypothetical protein
MKLEGADFAAVLADAQKLGYAETPPDLDIDGFDAAAQNRHPRLARARLLGEPERNPRRRHPHISALDIKFAGEAWLHDQAAGHRQKRARRAAGVQVSVYPTLIPERARSRQREPRFQRRLRARRHRGRHAVLRARRGQGRHRQRGVERSGGRRAGFEIRHQAPRAAVCAARMRRRGRADGRRRFAVLRPAQAWWTSPARWRKSRPFSARPKSASPPSSSPKATKAKACR